MIKNFMIFGDSYSTHKDHIPEGYAFYYADGGRKPEEPATKMFAKDTWWWLFREKTGANLVRNDSWTGSTIGHTGYSGDCSKRTSFIFRYRKLRDAGFFDQNEIDTIIVFGGTNDSGCKAPLGEEKYSDWEESELFSARPAICYFIHMLKQDHPDKRIVVVGNCGIKQEIIDCLRHAAEHFGAEYIGLHDIDKLCGHPTVTGMEQVCEQIMSGLGV